MKYCIAMDGGGTKIDSVLFDETGHIIFRHVAQGGSPLDIGVEEAKKRFASSLVPVLDKDPGKLSAVYGGMAGVGLVGDIFSDVLFGMVDSDSARFGGDCCNIMSSVLGHRDGCAMICGTGSSIFVRREGHPLLHLGGKGYLIDTEGSGFELGKAALKMALRSVDGRCGPTMLTELIEKKAGHPVDDTIIPIVHRGGRAYIASFASTVFEGRALGDRICCDIFEEQSAAMADLTFAAEPYFDGRFSVAMGGGIFAHFPEYVGAVKAKSSPKAEMLLQEGPPALGTAVEALWDAGVAFTDEIRQRFLTDYGMWEERLREVRK